MAESAERRSAVGRALCRRGVLVNLQGSLWDPWCCTQKVVVEGSDCENQFIAKGSHQVRSKPHIGLECCLLSFSFFPALYSFSLVPLFALTRPSETLRCFLHAKAIRRYEENGTALPSSLRHMRTLVGREKNLRGMGTLHARVPRLAAGSRGGLLAGDHDRGSAWAAAQPSQVFSLASPTISEIIICSYN